MDKPCGMIIAPRPASENPEAVGLLREVATLESDRAWIQELQRSNHDAIGEVFGGKYHMTNHLFWEITYKGRALEVMRFYPGKMVAIDIFETIGSDEQQEIDFKRDSFKRLGIRYAALSWEGSPADILPQIGLG